MNRFFHFISPLYKTALLGLPKCIPYAKCLRLPVFTLRDSNLTVDGEIDLKGESRDMTSVAEFDSREHP